jgi:peptidoglycan/xylan/chitin deacetylase (PgdA/CDA1 family)
MLKHTPITILFALVIISLAGLDYFYAVLWWHYLLATVVYLSMEVYGASYIGSNFHLKAVCDGKTDQKQISLTFDDGPTEVTEKVLDILKEEKVEACFFLIGSRVKKNREIASRIVREGHLVGNHSYSHDFWFDLKNTKQFIRDLRLASQQISEITGRQPLFFRPPYGVTTPALATASRYLGFRVIGWNVRSLDTKIRDQQRLLTRIKRKIRPGSIVLLHDTIAGTEIVLKELIRALRSEGYQFVALDKLLNKKAYA